MTKSKICAEIAALQSAALEDLIAMTDEEIRKEVLEDGENLDEIAGLVKSSMREAAAGTMRLRMAEAKVRSHRASTRDAPVSRPSIERIKQIIETLFATEPSLRLAFRDGKRQTESDWQTMYDDLIEMGAIMRNDDDV
ncbi:MAG: hypothetical protein J0M16_00260 [Gammaproteobacteria bacterium]|nr:hypothetical protein [Gammaproteobacteria bacterium]